MKCLLCESVINVNPSIFQLFFGRQSELPKVCDFCRLKFRKITNNHCVNCYKEGNYDKKICNDCIFWKKKFNIDMKHEAWYVYNQFMHDYFRSYKRSGDVELAKVFQQEISESKYFNQFDVVTYIPMSHEHLEKRQFNPVVELFKKLPLEGLFEVIRDTGTQALKNRSERINSPQKFELIKTISATDKILIVDDIYTTGRTLSLARQCILNTYPDASVRTFSLVR